MNTWLVGYDISDDRRWRKVYRIMRGYGDRIQYSVFMCILSERQMVTMEGALRDVIKSDEDRVFIINIGKDSDAVNSRIRTLGQSLKVPERVAIII